ncbi:hypothetical protein HJC23_013685 [Cyclotella cryptica]|uniref:UBC core domain-containing protein n=1 Tax=Cyclotella cryptica TaxID=29204 RepID=A0ABD3QWK7_9STRA
MIAGPDGSPYANGCFFFVINLPSTYPRIAPKVQFLTTGGGRIRFNPNLYNCGEVCLSLPGTWQGPDWISGESTSLQVRRYNANIWPHTIDAAIKSHLSSTQKNNNTYPEFEGGMVKHFLEKRSLIEKELLEDSRLMSQVQSVLELFERLSTREKEVRGGRS